MKVLKKDFKIKFMPYCYFHKRIKSYRNFQCPTCGVRNFDNFAIRFLLYKGAEYCGEVELEIRKIKGKVVSFGTHSKIKRKYRNQGLGIWLYGKAIAWALRNGHKISSSFGASEQAQRLWNSKTLRSRYKIIRKNYFACNAYVLYHATAPIH